MTRNFCQPLSRAAALLAVCLLSLSLTGLAARLPRGFFGEFVVAADTEVASLAGRNVLMEGGNAADAAVATMLALGVTSPASSGLGGGGFALYYRASTGQIEFFDFRETAPSAASASMFENAPGASSEGGLAVAVPGEPLGAEQILARYGSGRVTRSQVARDAIRFADEGFPVARFVARYSHMLSEHAKQDPLLASWLGTNPFLSEGTTLRNPALARTLREFAAHGAQSFYRGRIARAIVDGVHAHGGVLSAQDLRNYRTVVREPLAFDAFSKHIVTAPLPSAGGVVLAEALLATQARWPNGDYDFSDARFLHHLAQTWVMGFSDREVHLGDPVGQLLAHNREELTASAQAVIDPWLLLQSERMQSRVALIRDDVAQEIEAFHTGVNQTLPERTTHDVPSPHGTSHLCAVDREGNVMALTTTVNMPFGARVSVEGMLLNDQMDDFAPSATTNAGNGFGLAGAAHNLPYPGRRPLSSMAPTIVMENGRPIACIGASGGSRIPTAVTQVLLRMLRGESVAAAIAAPRIHAQGRPNVTSYERELPAALRAELFLRGHHLESVEASAIVQAIRIRAANVGDARLEAFADPRKGGVAHGF